MKHGHYIRVVQHFRTAPSKRMCSFELAAIVAQYMNG